MLVGKLLSVAMRGGGVRGVLGTIWRIRLIAFFTIRRGEMSVGDEIELRMIMADYDTKDGSIYEQHELLYT